METFFDKIKNSIQASLPIVTFLDWRGCCGLLAIHKGRLPDGEPVERLIVAHEGDWTDGEAMTCYGEYENYEEVQSRLGKNLKFRRKEYIGLLNRTLIEYSLDSDTDGILALPATGEETRCEIYGRAANGALYLLDEREL
ncbi:MAG: hypothetical protein J1E63_04665 [Muribaculaceae bacterium]|nr:hypothetical protein [Muribaculaceae bacterium]